MPINDLDHLKNEIESLLENEVAEGILRDKRDLYGPSKEDKKEFLKTSLHSLTPLVVKSSLGSQKPTACRPR
jgi:hypothetical protein